MHTANDSSSKKIYSSPKFVVFGDIKELTRSNNTTGAEDNGSTPGNIKHTGPKN